MTDVQVGEGMEALKHRSSQSEEGVVRRNDQLGFDLLHLKAAGYPSGVFHSYSERRLELGKRNQGSRQI